MPCGVQKAIDGNTATCDNSGTSSHTGLHSGTITVSAFRRAWVGVRVYWSDAAAAVVRQKKLVVGDGDL